ncbi:hypothetical protein NDU88_007944 [Pleurodeles waltl]|uniref:Uncharacterized protein n=1 Tax=Pleurodeles waltl TaxID=8319 RepID=A0AAV7NWB1_PLEWA|nr:hypothetical protein NDU88_007944 [Pleurodeles waltl]
MEQYTTPVVLLERAARLEVSGEPAGSPLNTEEPSQAELLAAIQGSRVALEDKIETVVVEVNLLQTDLRKVSDKVKMAEGSIAELQSEMGMLRKLYQRRLPQSLPVSLLRLLRGAEEPELGEQEEGCTPLPLAKLDAISLLRPGFRGCDSSLTACIQGQERRRSGVPLQALLPGIILRCSSGSPDPRLAAPHSHAFQWLDPQPRSLRSQGFHRPLQAMSLMDTVHFTPAQLPSHLRLVSQSSAVLTNQASQLVASAILWACRCRASGSLASPRPRERSRNLRRGTGPVGRETALRYTFFWVNIDADGIG